jgi:hypothetical protein
MGIGSEFRKFGRKFEDTSRRAAKYTFAAGGAMMGGAAGAKAGYELGSAFDDRKPQAQQSGTDLGKLRSDAVANGFNPLTVLRATGGQGFYHDQVPMGRLSSDAFFNAFDAYENYQNKNVTIDPTEIRPVDPMLSKSIAVNDPHVTQSKIMYQPSVLQEETVTSLLSNGMQITTDDKIKSIIGMTRDRHGKIHYHPWIEWEVDQMATQLAGNAWYEATYWRDKALKAIGKFFTSKKTDKISRQQVRDIVNSRKIRNNLHVPKLQSQPNYNQRISGVPINQQQRVMEQFP